MNRYELSHFSLDGRETLGIVRAPDWFPPYSKIVPGELLLVPQRPRTEGIRADSSGLLWVLISRGSQNMEPFGGRRTLPANAELPVPRDIDLNRFLSTTVEVLVPARGAVLARRTLENVALRFVSDARGELLVCVLRQADSGEMTVEILSLSMSRR